MLIHKNYSSGKKINIHPIIKFKKYFPKIEKNSIINKEAKIIGNTIIKSGNQIFKNVVIRGDGKKIVIGENCLFKNRCTVHVASDFLGTIIGNNCFFGEYSVIHACTIGNNVLVGENSVIMDGSIIGDNSIILADTLIPPGKIFKNNSLISGSPAKIINKIDNGYIRFFKKNALKSKKSYLNYVSKIKTSFKKINLEGSNVFLSSDLQCNAEIKAQKNSSIWFSVIIHSPRKEGCVVLGEGSNIQDNSILNTKGEKIEIGKRVTIGHNVIIDGKAVINEDAVIGMGSIIEKNCLVEKGAFVGANSYVEKNTIIPEGQIYAGKPAKFFRSVTSKEKKFFSLGQKIYEKLTKEYIKINN